MELVRQSIQVSEIEKNITHQFHVGEDMNVPDAKEDVVRVLQSYGKVSIQSKQKMEQYLKVKGCVKYQVLYATEDEEKRIACIEGEVPFDEMIYVEGGESDQYYVRCNQLDLQILLIHSRKMSLKALVELEVQKSNIRNQELTVDVEMDYEGSPSESSIRKKMKQVTVLELITNKMDTYRIKEEVKLPGTKENIGQVLLTRMSNVKLDTRAGRDEIILRGEAQFFCMYISDEWKEDYVTQTITFEGRIECLGLEEHQYHYMRYEIDDLSVDTQMDEDGELRIFNIEATLKMDVQVFQEQEMEVLDDIYTLDKKCELCSENIYLESLLLQNQSKCKIIEALSLPELRDDLLQICTADGMVQVEHVDVVEQGIVVEGILHLDFLYVRGDDRYPYASWKGMVPFTHQIECQSAAGMSYDLDCQLEQISINMAGNGEVEIKAVIHMQSFIRKPEILERITEVTVAPFTKEELEEQAGIIGYIYKEGDDMWSLAKRFHTTTEGILKINKISEKDIKVGRKLLIFKENMSIL